ncbi:MAG: substrate-binding domain-containing protein [Mobilitalea sp.]
MMIKRKSIIDILIIIVAFSLFVIWNNKNENDTVPTLEPSLEFFKVYLITMDKTDQFWYSIDQGASDMAELAGVTYLWEAPERKDTALQIEILNKAVNDGAAVIMLAANDPIKISSAVEDAKARAVKIIYVDSPANEQAIVKLSTNNYIAGVTAAETMLYELEELGIKSGSIGIIGVNKVTDSTLEREAGFRKTIEADGRFTLLNTVYGNGITANSRLVSAGLIEENTDLVGLFGTNEGSAEGMGDAIKASNKPIIGIGFDKSDTILELIQDGSIKATIAQNPYTMGYLGMAEAIAAIRGYRTGPDYINTGVTIIKKR